MAQDPGRVFPGKRMTGQYGDVTRTVQKLTMVRIDTDRGLLLVKGSVPGAKGGDVVVRPGSESAGEEGGMTMELNVINDKGQAAATVTASDALFGREYNEALIHQVVTAYQANARRARGSKRAQRNRQVARASRGNRKEPDAPAQEGE